MKKAEEEKLELRYVPLEQAVLWDKNPKKHDYSAIMESIKKYGFKDPPKLEPRLNGTNGKAIGGIVEGNGRITCLRDMHMNNEPRPRGILGDDKTWLVPILFGVDAESQEAAMGYALDHNALTLLGGDFGMYDLAKLYEQDIYAQILKDLQDADLPPVSMDYDDIGAFLNTIRNGNGAIVGSDESEMLQSKFQILIDCKSEEVQTHLLEELSTQGYECRALIS